MRGLCVTKTKHCDYLTFNIYEDTRNEEGGAESPFVWLPKQPGMFYTSSIYK